jgi:nitrogen fixation protein FixH
MVVVAATIGTMVVGSRVFDGVVVERPYEAGLSWDDVQKRQLRLGWKVAVVNNMTMKRGENELVLKIADREGVPLQNVTVAVTVSRPSTKAYDRKYRAVSMGSDRYQVPISLPLAGLWDIRTEVIRQKDLYTSVERIEAAE